LENLTVISQPAGAPVGTVGVAGPRRRRDVSPLGCAVSDRR